MPKKESVVSSVASEFDFCDIGNEMKEIEQIKT
jgi:hypothetical protein